LRRFSAKMRRLSGKRSIERGFLIDMRSNEKETLIDMRSSVWFFLIE
jgi:hypothetical protein